jgi:putative redox protein
MPIRTLVVKNKVGLAHEITVDGHRLIADEPEPEGHDEGPDPHELMMASLGACQAVTLRMYCNRKGWDLGDVVVTVTNERLDDGSERIDSHITATGRLDEEQRQRLEEIMGRCPISRLLKGTPHMTDRLELTAPA